MAIYDHLEIWNGMPVKNWDLTSETAPDFENNIYRLSHIAGERTIFWRRKNQQPAKSFESFLSRDGVESTRGLILSSSTDLGGDVASDIAILVEAKDKLPNLRYLFLGELTAEECEISWIQQGDITPVLEAFPGLEELVARGGEGLRLNQSRHICLKKLTIESGGLVAKDVFPGMLDSVFPELEHLEIWAGTEDYGWDGSIEDFRPFLHQNPFPKLKSLGLKNSQLQNEIAILAADAPILDQLETLDLSMGSLRDTGATALLSSEKIRHLKKLDLSHHFMSDEVMDRFADLPIEVDVSDQEEAWNDFDDEDLNYYVAVGE